MQWQLFAAENVEVHMLHTLTAVLSDIGNDAVAFRQPFRCGDLRYLGKNVCDNIGVSFGYLVCRVDVLLGYHEYMNGGFRVYVSECKYALVLVDLGRGYLTRNYFTENAIHISFSFVFFYFSTKPR